MKSYILVLVSWWSQKSKIAWEVFLYSFAKRPLTSDANFCSQWSRSASLFLFQSPSDTEDLDECDGSSDPSSPSDASFVSQHALRRAELGRQLQELNKALALKEELANKMVSNDARLSNMRKQYEVSGS